MSHAQATVLRDGRRPSANRRRMRAVDSSYETTDQFIEFRPESAFRIRDLLKAR